MANRGFDALADKRWLAEMFEFEVCAECGWDADKHRVDPDVLGNRHATCTDPISPGLSDQAAERELARRVAISTGATRRKGVVNTISGTVHGTVIQTGGDIQGGINF